MHKPINVIHFLPVQDKENEAKNYQCPVYKTQARQGTLTTTGLSSNFIIAVDLPCKESPNKWTLRGTALLCEIID